jgi:hypothetical protein
LRRIRIGALAFTLGFLAVSSASTASAQTPETAEAASAATKPAPAEPTPPAVLLNSPARFGLGLNVGNVLTGVTAKLWAASSVAFQAAVGEGAEGNNFRAHLDLLFSVGTWTSADGQYVLPAYLGIGGVLGHHFAAGASASDTEGGFRIPLGMSVLIRGNPVELFFELAPAFTVRSDATLRGKYGVYTDGAIGARYYF